MGVATLGQNGHGSDGIEEISRILQSSDIIEGSQFDCLVLYPGHPLG